jgi:hypothetical protein
MATPGPIERLIIDVGFLIEERGFPFQAFRLPRGVIIYVTDESVERDELVGAVRDLLQKIDGRKP